MHRRVLGEDRDALFAFQIRGVHDPLGHLLVGTERAGLAEHCIDEGGLAVVDVSHDRHIADVIAREHYEAYPRDASPEFVGQRGYAQSTSRYGPTGHR